MGLRRILEILHMVKPIDYNSVEFLRSRGVKIGENVDILNSLIDGCHGFLISIGNNVTITGARLLAHDGSTKKFLGYSKVGRIDIGNDVFVGQGAIILPNTKIGNRVIIGAGCVVGKNIPDNSVVIGNPCQILCSFDEYIEKNRKRLEEGPVYETIFSKKTNEEKNRMYNELNGRIGFDV